MGILFDYKCNSCEFIVESDEKINCPQCCGEMEKIFTAMNFKLKGNGFHSTDYPGSKKIFKKESIKKMSKEQKLAMAAKLIEHQTQKDIGQMHEEIETKEIKAENINGEIKTRLV